MKRLIPFLSCLISFAHAQVERFDMEYTLRVQQPTSPTGEKLPVTAQDHKQAAFTLERRLKSLRLKKAKVTAKGSDRILLTISQLTGAEAEALHTALTTPAKLELKLVHPDNRKLANKIAADPDNESIPGYELKVLKYTDQDGKATSENLLVKRKASVDGSDIIHTQELYGRYEGQLDVELNREGATKMFNCSSKMNHGSDRLAIVLDGKVLSAPVVQSSLSKKFQVSGISNAKEAKTLAAALLNPFKTSLLIEEEKRTPSHLTTDPSKKAAP